MSIEERVSKLEMQMKNLQQAFLDMQRSQVTTVGRVDDTSNKVTAITPYTETKTAYILDTEVVFKNVPQGNTSVFFDIPTDYTINRVNDSVVISFEPLVAVTGVTISIQ